MKDVTPAMASRSIWRGLAVVAIWAAASPASAISNDEALALCLSDLTANRGATGISDSRVIRSDREPAVYGTASFGGADPVEFRCLISGGAVSSVRYLVEDQSAGVDASGNRAKVWVEEQPDGSLGVVEAEPEEPAAEEGATDEETAEAPAEEEPLIKPQFQRPGEGSGLKRFSEQQQPEGDETAEAEDKPLFQKVPQSN